VSSTEQLLSWVDLIYALDGKTAFFNHDRVSMVSFAAVDGTLLNTYYWMMSPILIGQKYGLAKTTAIHGRQTSTA
jgi:hypothetical protein